MLGVGRAEIVIPWFTWKKSVQKITILCCYRWIYHHYCAMIMAVVSLTWEIKGQPDCANKQVSVLSLSTINFSLLMASCIYLICLNNACREVYSCSYSGLWCKELQCFCKIDINDRGFILVLRWERCHC